MRPFTGVNGTYGYDATYGMIRGGQWSGGWKNGFVLIDSNLIVGTSLDYFNDLAGNPTHIAANVQTWLTNTTFVDPQTGAQGTYQGNDRREILLGHMVACVMDTSGQEYYAPGHALSDPVPITTALPTDCVNNPSNGAMSVLVPAIDLAYLDGDFAQALTMFNSTIGGWTPTAGTGVGSSTGGYFSYQLDGGTCKSSRTLALWIQAARATGYWDIDAQTREVAQEVQNQLWANQGSDGGVSGPYPDCSKYNPVPESSGYTLLAYDPRLPTWFNSGGGALPEGLPASSMPPQPGQGSPSTPATGEFGAYTLRSAEEPPVVFAWTSQEVAAERPTYDSL